MITENLDTFLVDFGVEVVFGGEKFVGVLDAPDQIIGNSMSVSTEYLLTVKTSDISDDDFSHDESITVDGDSYKTREYRKIDDGKFARILLTKQ